MNFFFTAFFLIFTFQPLFGQITAKKWSIFQNGTGHDATNLKKHPFRPTKSFSFISPEIDYHFTAALSAGGSFWGYNYKRDIQNGRQAKRFYLSAHLKYHFFAPKKFNPYALLSFRHLWSSAQKTYFGKTIENNWTLFIGTGFLWQFSEGIALDVRANIPFVERERLTNNVEGIYQIGLRFFLHDVHQKMEEVDLVDHYFRKNNWRISFDYRHFDNKEWRALEYTTFQFSSEIFFKHHAYFKLSGKAFFQNDDLFANSPWNGYQFIYGGGYYFKFNDLIYLKSQFLLYVERSHIFYHSERQSQGFAELELSLVQLFGNRILLEIGAAYRFGDEIMPEYSKRNVQFHLLPEWFLSPNFSLSPKISWRFIEKDNQRLFFHGDEDYLRESYVGFELKMKTLFNF